MTGEDHDNDAVIAALTSAALPSERVGEAAAVTAMLDALPATPARPAGRRPRRGIAIAAVTVASLGVGGLVAAGPGAFFFIAADRSPATTPAPTIDSDTLLPTPDPDERITGAHTTAASSTTLVDVVVDVVVDTTFDTLGGNAVEGEDVRQGDADECDGNHGEAVSDVARSTVPHDEARDIARSDCGKPDPSDRESPSDTAPGRTDESPSDTAPGRTDESPSDTAPSRTDESPADTDESPADTALGPTGNEDGGSSGSGRP